MTKVNNLLRRPRAPKLQKVDLTDVKITSPVPSEGDSSNASSTDTTSTEREFVASSLYLQGNRTLFPSLTPKNTQLAFRSNQEKSRESRQKNGSALTDLSAIPTDETPAKTYEDDDRNILSMKNFSRDTYKRLLSVSISPGKPMPPVTRLSRAIEEVSESEETNMLREYSQFMNNANKALKPLKPRGPDPLPARQPRHFEDKKKEYENLVYDERPKPVPFTFNDFMLEKTDDSEPIEKTELVRAVLSAQNYRGVCKILEEKIRLEQNKNSNTVHVQTLVPDFEPFEHRIPLRQIIIEMASYLKKELSEKMGVNLKAKLNTLPKWQNTQGAHTEIVVYEDEKPEKHKTPQAEATDENSTEGQITISQLAIVDSLLRNGLALSLKGHFINKLPDVSALEKTLIYINLSFNCFEDFPSELLSFLQLEAIKLRNNPLRSLPLELNQLRNLKILTLSYCKLDTDIPTAVYMLENLRHLDVSYNKIKYISKMIVNLNHLKHFNCEGNELEYLPSAMLGMRTLKRINVKNNYLHPLLWKDAMKNQPQKLFDMATHALKQNYERYAISKRKITPDVEYLLQNPEFCDCCGGPRYGDGLKLIKPCVKIFGVKYMPFMFQCCSSTCLKSYRREKSFYSDHGND